MKVQNEMSTRISVDAVSAIGSMSAFRNAIRGASDAWRAQETALRNSGDFAGAAQERLRGLNQVIDLQKAKLKELQDRQDGLNLSNQKQANQYLKLERQIQQANRQLSSYESQSARAREAALYHASGLAKLQHQTKLNQDVSSSYVASLRAQGKAEKASREEIKGLATTIEELEKQQTKQEFLLKQIENQSGKTSDAYKEQYIQLNKTAEAIGNARKRSEELKLALNPPRVSGWKIFRDNILQVDKAEEKAKQGVLNFGSALKANIMGGWVQQSFSYISTQMKSIVVNGTEAAKAGAALEARWKNIGVSDSGVEKLSAQVKNLKTNTNLSAQAINALQSRFYGMNHSISQTSTLTKGVASLTDQLKLSQQQADAFAGGLSRIESSGNVTSSSLGRLEKQAPGLTAAMSKASGMSQQAFKNLVSSGKMTADQFNAILAKSSKDYDKNAKAFGESSGGALHKLQQEWVSTQAKLAKPLLKVSATGLNELSTALNNKDTQRGLEMLGNYMAKAAVEAAKLIGYLAKHQTTLKVFGITVLGVAASFKAMQAAVVAADTVKGFIALMGKAKEVKTFGLAIKGLGVAFRFMTGPIGLTVTAVAGVGVALTALYKHNKKFRNFVNGLSRDAKKGMQNVGKWFKTTFSNISKQHQQAVRNSQRHNQQAQRNWNNYWRSVQRGWNNYWRQQNRQQQQNQRTQERQELASQRRRQRAIANFNRTVSRDAQNAWRGMERAAQNGSNRVDRWYDQLNRTTSRSIQNMARNHPRLFNDMYRTIQDRTRVWHDVVTGHWSNLRDDTAKLAQDSSRTNKNIFEDMYSVINQKTDGWLGKVVDSWKNHMSSIGDAIESARKKAGQAMADLANGVLKPFKTLIDDIQGGINWVLDKVGGNKLGGSWSAAIPTFATGTKGNPNGLKKATIGMVNDGAGSHWRELYSYKGHVGAFPNKRNFITYLPEGMSILNGEDSHQLMKMMDIPHFANGVGDFFNAIKDGSDDLLEYVDKIVKAPAEFMKDVFQKFVKVSTHIPFAQSLVTSVPPFIAKQIADWVKKQFATLDNPGGAGVERWRPYIIRAFKELGVDPAEWKVAKLLRQIQTESGGDPHAFQHGYVDANTGGNEARGLLQFAGSTRRADALPGHTDWRNGYNEILAAIHVLEQGGEGGWGNVGNGHGWANGGVISAHGFYEVAEQNKPEMIIPLDPSRRGRAYQLLSEVMAQFKHEDSSTESNSDDQGYGKRQFDDSQSRLENIEKGLQSLIGLMQMQIAVTRAQDIQQARALQMKFQQYGR